MKTLMAKKIDSRTADYKIGNKEYKRNWYVVDAAGVPLGRLASVVASVLKGKTKPEYTPNTDVGDFVIVVNTDKVVLTGNKADKKLRTYHTGYMGGLKQQKYSHFLEENSDKAVAKAVKGMLPKNSLGRKMIKKLKLFKGAEHNHEAQHPQQLAIGLNKDKANKEQR